MPYHQIQFHPYLPTPPLGQDITQGQFLNGVFLLLDYSLPFYLSIAGGRIIGFIPFPRVLVLCEMQSASSRFWTRVAVSISYDYNHYTMCTSDAVKSSVRLTLCGNSTAPADLAEFIWFNDISTLDEWSMPNLIHSYMIVGSFIFERVRTNLLPNGHNYIELLHIDPWPSRQSEFSLHMKYLCK